jgi:biopolymer transport protein ExbD
MLEHLKQENNIIHPALAIAFMDFILLIILLIMTATVFAKPSGVEIRFPWQSNGRVREAPAAVIDITSENVIYLNNKVVTLNELRTFLAQSDLRNALIYIKADRRSSMGRVTDVFDLCRGISGARINVSSSF